MKENHFLKTIPSEVAGILSLCHDKDKFHIECFNYFVSIITLDETISKYSKNMILEYKEMLEFFRQKGKEGAEKRYGKGSPHIAPLVAPLVAPPIADYRLETKDLEIKDNKIEDVIEGDKPESALQCYEYFLEKTKDELKAEKYTDEFIEYYKSYKWHDKHGGIIKNWKLKAIQWINREKRNDRFRK